MLWTGAGISDGQRMRRDGVYAVGITRDWSEKARDEADAILAPADGKAKARYEDWFDLAHWSVTEAGTGTISLKKGGLEIASGAVLGGSAAVSLGGAGVQNKLAALIEDVSVEKWFIKTRFILDAAVAGATDGNFWMGMKTQDNNEYIYPGWSGANSNTVFSMLTSAGGGTYVNSTVGIDLLVHELTMYNVTATTTAKFKFDTETAINFTVVGGIKEWYTRMAGGNGSSSAARTGRVLDWYAKIAVPING